MDRMLPPTTARRISSKLSALPALAIAAYVLATSPASATPPIGQTVLSGPFRAQVRKNINVNQWVPLPLLNLQIQSSDENWGFDVITVDAQYAAADASGRPSSSGWHSHPAALTMVQVLQGTVMQWDHETPNCLSAYPAGSIWFESPGHAHNVFNTDPKGPAVVRITYILDRSLTVTRTDEPDPFTNSQTVSSAPPATVCASNVAVRAVPSPEKAAKSAKNAKTADSHPAAE